MKKFLVVLLSFFMIVGQVFAGSSFSSRSSYSSSRSSYSSPGRSSGFSSRSSYSSGSSYKASSNSYNGRYASGSSNNSTTSSIYRPTSGSPVVSRTTTVNNYGNNGPSYNGGPSALGTAAAVAGGVVAGNLLTNALTGHNHPTVVVQQPLQDNPQVQQDLNSVVQSQDGGQNTVNSGGQVVSNQQSDSSPLTVALGVIIGVFVIALIIAIIAL